MKRWPRPETGSRRRIQEWLKTIRAVFARPSTGRSTSAEPRPRPYLRARRQMPQAKTPTETKMRKYQNATAQVGRFAKVSRVASVTVPAYVRAGQVRPLHECTAGSIELLELLGDLEDVADGAVVGDVEDR